MWRNGQPHTLLEGVEMGTTFLTWKLNILIKMKTENLFFLAYPNIYIYTYLFNIYIFN